MIAALAVVSVGAIASSKDEQAIHKFYDKLTSASKSKNLPAIEALEAPGYSVSMKGRTMTGQQANAQLKMAFTFIKSYSKFAVKLTSIKVSGNTATVHTTRNLVGTIEARGQKHSLEANSTTIDTLTKTSKGWLLQATKNLSSSAKVDGKAVPIPG